MSDGPFDGLPPLEQQVAQTISKAEAAEMLGIDPHGKRAPRPRGVGRPKEARRRVGISVPRIPYLENDGAAS